MPHMVIYRSAEGKPAYHQAEALDDAVRFVEHMRNHEKVAEARIFAMQEVPIEVRTYFRVEVTTADGPSIGSEPAAAAEAPASQPAPARAAAAEPPPPAPVPVTVPAESHKPEPVAVAPGNGSGRFGLFGKG